MESLIKQSLRFLFFCVLFVSKGNLSDLILLFRKNHSLDNTSKQIDPGKMFSTRLHVRPMKTQISQCICAIRSESSQDTLWEVKIQSVFRWTAKTGQPARMLIWIFAGRTCLLVGNALSRFIVQCLNVTILCIPVWYSRQTIDNKTKTSLLSIQTAQLKLLLLSRINLADNKVMIFLLLLFLPEKKLFNFYANCLIIIFVQDIHVGFDIQCEPKCQILFPRKNKKQMSKCRLLRFYSVW